MTFRVGQRVRCIEMADVLNPLQVGSVYTVRSLPGIDGLMFLREVEYPYYARRFEAIDEEAPEVIRVGDRVECINSAGTLYRVGREYIIHGLRGNYVLVRGYWTLASRFRRVGRAAPSDVMATPYQISGFHGCCGANIIYFAYANTIDPDRLKASENRAKSHSIGTLLAILTKGQRKNGEKTLLAAGWQLVGQSINRAGGGQLFTYFKALKPVKEVVEPLRKFG